MSQSFLRIRLTVLLPIIVFFGIACSKKVIEPTPSVPVLPGVTPKSDVAMWLTNPDKSALFQRQSAQFNFNSGINSFTNIVIDTSLTYQSIDGFGYSMTGGSASVINGLETGQRDALLKELFQTDSTNIGISYLRISLGSSDLSAEDFTYDDVPAGQIDLDLAHFSIDKEKNDLIPVLKKILSLNPKIKILACPWTAPAWMKVNTISNNGFTGGSLNPAYYDVYAAYFVKYIQAMQAQGIPVDAITPQNEPLTANNEPAMVVQPGEESSFIKDHLGPAFKSAGLTTKIIVYDHNPDRTDYPLDILSDSAANPFVDGSAFHLYAGNIGALTPVHNAFPDKNIYFTEEYTSTNGNFAADFSWHMANLVIGAPKNWSRNVLEWNLATDASFGPHTPTGCSTCLGALTINHATITRNVSYYIIAHASKFVRPGAVRISSSEISSLPNVAFKNTDGSKVLIVLNSANAPNTFNIKFNGRAITSTLASGAAATYVW